MIRNTVLPPPPRLVEAVSSSMVGIKYGDWVRNALVAWNILMARVSVDNTSRLEAEAIEIISRLKRHDAFGNTRRLTSAPHVRDHVTRIPSVSLDDLHNMLSCCITANWQIAFNQLFDEYCRSYQKGQDLLPLLANANMLTLVNKAIEFDRAEIYFSLLKYLCSLQKERNKVILGNRDFFEMLNRCIAYNKPVHLSILFYFCQMAFHDLISKPRSFFGKKAKEKAQATFNELLDSIRATIPQAEEKQQTRHLASIIRHYVAILQRGEPINPHERFAAHISLATTTPPIIPLFSRYLQIGYPVPVAPGFVLMPGTTTTFEGTRPEDVRVPEPTEVSPFFGGLTFTPS